MTTTQATQSESGADHLLGLSIHDGWTITEILPRPGTPGAEDLTGSWFSRGYIAKKGNDEAFVKVIDIARALTNSQGAPLMEKLKQITDSHSFECSILDICDKAKLDRIVRIIAKGEIMPPLAHGCP